MSYGVRVRDANGVEVFNSNTARAGVIIGVAKADGTPQTILFPEFAGRTVFAMTSGGYTNYLADVDYALGYPRVQISGAWNNLTYIIFAV